jgi:hypothetical protein
MFNVRLQFKVRPTLVTKNSKWEPNNTLCVSFDKKPTKEALEKIIKFLKDQDTSGISPIINYYYD